MHNTNPDNTDLKDRSHSSPSLRRESPATNWMKEFIPYDNTISRMSRIFQALQSTTRLKILFLLSRKDMCVCELVYTLGMTQSAISHSLRVLNHLDLVRVSKKGKFAVYSIADEHVIALIDMCLEHVTEREKWTG